MSTPTNHWKLGLFVVSAILVGLAGVVYFGSRNLPSDVVTYVSYFDEAVTGLEIGAPVKYRGVTLGNVSNVEVAPDRRHVQVSYGISSGAAKRLALQGAGGEKSRIAADLRAQLGSQGVTGVKYISLDLFERADPPEELPFDLPPRYIPATASTLKNLESAVTDAANRLPELTEQLVVMLRRINGMLEAVEQEHIPQRTSATLDNVDQVLAVLQSKLEGVRSAELSQEAVATLQQVQGTVGRVNQLLERVDGKEGVLANAERASTSMGDVARNASQVGTEAERTLRDVGEAATAVRKLAEALERQPDMLLKGRARSTP